MYPKLQPYVLVPCVILSLLASACASTPSVDSRAAQPASRLQKLEATADGFSVLFPGQPQPQRQVFSTLHGEARVATWSADLAGARFTLNITDNPPEALSSVAPGQFLAQLRDQALQEVPGLTLLAEERLTLQGHLGLAYTYSVDTTLKDGTRLRGQAKARHYLVGNRAYTLGVFYDPEQGDPGVDEFLGSLQLAR